MAEKEYHRLTRSRPRSGFSVAVVGRCSLWLGKDHLMLVETAGFNESYKRFYFRDIQAISFYRTARWNIWSGVLSGFIVLFLALGIATGEIAGFVTFGIVAAVFITGLLANLVMGPSCRCYLRTAVHTEELPSISRIKKARKILERIRPLIGDAQGQMTPEEITQKFRGAAFQAYSPGFSQAPTEQAATDDPAAPPRMVS